MDHERSCRCFNMHAAQYFNVGLWHVDWTRQTREVRPQNIQRRLFHGSRAIVSALLVYSQRYGGKTKFACQCFPVSRIHWNIAAQKRGRNGEDPLSESPRCPPPSMPSLQFIRLHNYTVVFNKFCRALRWADSTPCGPKRVGGTDPGIIASLELNGSRTHKNMDMALLTSWKPLHEECTDFCDTRWI